MTATSVEGFLAARIRSVQRALPLASTDAVCREVWKTLTPTDLQRALKEALPVFVEQIRGGVQSPVPDARPKPDAPSAGSWKKTAARKYAADWLSERIEVPDGGWKPIADCSPVELRGAAGLYRARADRFTARAEQLRLLADRVQKAGVVTPDFLSPSALEGLELGR